MRVFPHCQLYAAGQDDKTIEVHWRHVLLIVKIKLICNELIEVRDHAFHRNSAIPGTLYGAIQPSHMPTESHCFAASPLLAQNITA